MQRMVMTALALGATVLSARAQSIPLDSTPYSPDGRRASLETPYRLVAARPEPQPVYRVPGPAEQYEAERPMRQPVQQAQAPRMQYAGPRGADLGGGFIEFLFNGAEPRRQPSRPVAVPPAAEPMPGPSYVPPLHASVPPIRPTRPAPAMDAKFLPTVVDYDGREQSGTIIINTEERFLYLVLKDGMAKRYGIGVGRPGFTWAGNHKVTAKRQWPDWHPPEEMLKRRPDLPHFMAGGPDNPLGARALYLGSTLYRIHGSNEPWTIGRAVSSGCIRMRNQDVIDLYDRVGVGSKVVVI